MHYKSNYASPIGQLTIISDEVNILEIWFESEKLSINALGCSDAIDKEAEPIKIAKDWLDRYFGGLMPTIDGLPLDPHGTPFQKCVWGFLRGIPYGKSVTYGQIARYISDTKGSGRMSAQAVGQAVGLNPISIMIPCHRVLGADSKLTGYAGGLEKKKWLLVHEKIRFNE